MTVLDDRFIKTGVTIKRKTPGKNILLCPPSQKALTYWGVDLKEWIETTTQEIAKHTDRPIIITRKTKSSHTYQR